jgi:formylglycine-generating enzyme required for sulfatase activity
MMKKSYTRLRFAPLLGIVAASALVLQGIAFGKDEPGISEKRPAAEPSVAVDGKFMIPYVTKLPGTEVSFVMMPVPGGEFLLGSPKDEKDRNDDEGPQVRVKVEPFWIGKTEVTWAEYKAFMQMYNAFKQLQTLAANRNGERAAKDSGAEAWKLIESHAWKGDVEKESPVDAVTSPTPLYMPDHTYSAGDKPDQPAVTMTQFAARQYTKWLSGITGQEFRLPSEAEWEYAARAGTKTAYSFGDDAGELDKYGWFADNSDYATHAVGTKEPNAWGLYDMHGNVAEWTLDQYAADRYAKLAPGPVEAWKAVNWPTKLFPRVIRGGSWLDEPKMLRSAARQASEEEDWKMSDPNLPLSPWWYTEEPALGVGMRLVRPLRPMSDEDKRRVWEADVDDLRGDVKSRLREGRGALGVADPSLPQAVKAAEQLGTGK